MHRQDPRSVGAGVRAIGAGRCGVGQDDAHLAVGRNEGAGGMASRNRHSMVPSGQRTPVMSAGSVLEPAAKVRRGGEVDIGTGWYRG